MLYGAVREPPLKQTMTTRWQPDQVPYSEINRFYFEEVVGTMHPSIQPLATDFRVLHHEPEARHSRQIAEELYQPQYSHVPYMVAEYFDLPPDLLLKIGKGWWLSIIDVVVTDQAVDRQLPDIPAISLMTHHVRLHAQRMFRAAFSDSEFFWTLYHAAHAGIWNGLAHESHCVDAHEQVYTFEEMQHVCASRSNFIAMILTMMARLSDREAFAAPLITVYENLTFADQLLDDANDWKGDFRGGRHTLPVVMAAREEGIPLSQASDYEIEEFTYWLDRHSILIYMAETAASLLTEAQAALDSLPANTSPLREVLTQRLGVARHAVKRYHAMRAMTALLKRADVSVK